MVKSFYNFYKRKCLHYSFQSWKKKVRRDIDDINVIDDDDDLHSQYSRQSLNYPPSQYQQSSSTMYQQDEYSLLAEIDLKLKKEFEESQLQLTNKDLSINENDDFYSSSIPNSPQINTSSTRNASFSYNNNNNINKYQPFITNQQNRAQDSSTLYSQSNIDSSYLHIDDLHNSRSLPSQRNPPTTSTVYTRPTIDAILNTNPITSTNNQNFASLPSRRDGNRNNMNKSNSMDSSISNAPSSSSYLQPLQQQQYQQQQQSPLIRRNTQVQFNYERNQQNYFDLQNMDGLDEGFELPP
jgi:hypothetical protein